MIIGGLEKLSLIDFPGEIAAVIFTQACNFRCHFCYNPMLVLTEEELQNRKIEGDHVLIPEDDLLLFLQKRLGKITGVVISGGEPTLQRDLIDFIKKLKKMNLKVKLDSNGSRPEIIEKILKAKIIDYLAMDIKAPIAEYEKIINAPIDKKAIKKSIDLIRKHSCPYEFRSTLVPGLHNKDSIIKMAQELAGAEKWFLQKFKSDTSLVNDDFQEKRSFTDKEMREFLLEAQKWVPNCKIRD